MDQQGTGFKGDGANLADVDDSPPLACGLQAEAACISIALAINSYLEALSMCLVKQHFERITALVR